MILQTMTNEELVDRLGTILIESGLKLDSSEKIADDYPERLKAELLSRLNPQPVGDAKNLLGAVGKLNRLVLDVLPVSATYVFAKLEVAIAALQAENDTWRGLVREFAINNPCLNDYDIKHLPWFDEGEYMCVWCAKRYPNPDEAEQWDCTNPTCPAVIARKLLEDKPK